MGKKEFLKSVIYNRCQLMQNINKVNTNYQNKYSFDLHHIYRIKGSIISLYLLLKLFFKDTCVITVLQGAKKLNTL